MRTYHLGREDLHSQPVCGLELMDTDIVVNPDEARSSEGRHFNCVACHKRLTGGHAHVPPPAANP